MIDAIFESASEEQKENFLRQTNEDGHTALDFAAKYSTEPNIITRLLARGMQPQQASGSWNPFKKDFITQPLHLAASRTDDFAGVMMLRLLAAGADVFLQDEDGNTALHIYMKNKNAWVLDVRLLLEVQNWQASIFRLKALELKNKKNDTVLGLATQKINDLLIMQEMLFYEADPDHVDQEGWTPLLIYTFKGENPDVFQLLLEDSEEVCDIQVSKGKSKGATVIMLLKNNEKLYNLDNFDGSSPMALLKEKCPA